MQQEICSLLIFYSGNGGDKNQSQRRLNTGHTFIKWKETLFQIDFKMFSLCARCASGLNFLLLSCHNAVVILCLGIRTKNTCLGLGKCPGLA